MKKWIQAARLRTIPLSISGILVGCGLSLYKVQNWLLIILCIATAISLQILSNFANDYGDFLKGTDNDNRIGPSRTMQLGIINKNEMKNALVITSLISGVLGITTSLIAFKNIIAVIYIIIGIICIVAAIKYTIGKNPYGYKGFGDLSVFIFFGLVSVIGSNFLITKIFDYDLLLPAFSLGLFSTAVLNLNNMRDIENDKKHAKNTLVTKIGLKKAFIYHHILIILGLILSIYYLTINTTLNLINYIPSIAILLFISHLVRINKKGLKTNFDPELKRLALSIFMFSILLFTSKLIIC